jgi:hypothetical protein
MTRDEFYVAERAVGFGGDHQARGVGQAGQHGAGFGQGVFEAAAAGFQGVADGFAFFLGQFAELQQAVDEQTQAAIGGKAAGGGVGGEQQAGLGEVSHDVANGGRREGERGAREQGGGQAAREGAAADRLAGFYILFDHLAQHRGAARIQALGQVHGTHAAKVAQSAWGCQSSRAGVAAGRKDGMVLLQGIEPWTSPLPRECSTPELQQQREARRPGGMRRRRQQTAPAGRGGSALAGLHAGVFLVDHVDAAVTAHHAAILVPRLGGF